MDYPGDLSIINIAHLRFVCILPVRYIIQGCQNYRNLCSHPIWTLECYRIKKNNGTLELSASSLFHAIYFKQLAHQLFLLVLWQEARPRRVHVLQQVISPLVKLEQ